MVGGYYHYEKSNFVKKRTVFDSGLKLTPLYKFSKIGYGNMGDVKESAVKCLIKYTIEFIFRKEPVFQKYIKVFRTLPNCVHTANTGIQAQHLPANKITLFDQAFHGAFLTAAILPYPVFEILYT